MIRDILLFCLGCVATITSVSWGLSAGFFSKSPAIGVLVFIAVAGTLCFLAVVAEISVRAIRRSLEREVK